MNYNWAWQEIFMYLSVAFFIHLSPTRQSCFLNIKAIKTMEFPSDLKRKRKELELKNKIRGSTPIPSHRSVPKRLHLVGSSGGGKNAAVGVGQFYGHGSMEQ